jgi:hypothetical protein
MALGFLSDIANVVSGVSGPLGQILGAIGGNKNDRQNDDLRKKIIKMSTNFPQSEAERQSIALRLALADPNNSLVKALTAQEERSGSDALQSEIRSKVLADRREAAMGRAPVFFDPERADENINFQTTRGAPGIKAQAQRSAMERILAAAGVGNFASTQDQRYQGNLNALASLYTMNKESPQQDNVARTSGYLQQGIGGLQQIMDLFSKKPTYGPYQQPQNETIRWNQMRY